MPALFPRNRVKDAGLAPLTSMYWYGENTSNTFGGWRPEVHDSDGLQVLRGNGEWLWHPLAWAKQRQVNVLDDTNPRGFGLFQRDRDFSLLPGPRGELPSAPECVGAARGRLGRRLRRAHAESHAR